MTAKNTTSKATQRQLNKAAQLFGAGAVNATEPVQAAERRTPDMMAQFVSQQLTTPVALTGERAKLFHDRMDALSQEFGIPVKAVEVKIAKVKVAQNGITRPGANTKCGLIFEVADKITAQTGMPATIAAVKASCTGINDHTVKTQYARWRQFNGIVGRIVAPVIPPVGPTVETD